MENYGKNKMENYGVKWSEWNNQDRRVIKKKFFKTQRGLELFVERLKNKESFIRIEGWRSPSNIAC